MSAFVLSCVDRGLEEEEEEEEEGGGGREQCYLVICVTVTFSFRSHILVG
jgi:hypothetical protein